MDSWFALRILNRGGKESVWDSVIHQNWKLVFICFTVGSGTPNLRGTSRLTLSYKHTNQLNQDQFDAMHEIIDKFE